MELPPRARRIPTAEVAGAIASRTTSACAENTTPDPLNAKTHGNYLRVRGEYIAYAKAYASKPELPPRARRIPNIKEQEGLAVGTTSACAENTYK